MTPPPLPVQPPVPPRAKTSRAVWIGLSLSVLFVAFLGFRVVQAIVHFRKHPLKQPPGTEELTEATRVITTNNHGIAHGNTPEAKQIAGDISKQMKAARQLFFTKGKADSMDVNLITKDEFIVFCQMNADTCVALIHVPEMRRYTTDAKEAMSQLAYTVVCNELPLEYKKSLRRLVVATRGTMMFDTILSGSEGFTELEPATYASTMPHKGILAPELNQYFVPTSTAAESK